MNRYDDLMGGHGQLRVSSADDFDPQTSMGEPHMTDTERDTVRALDALNHATQGLAGQINALLAERAALLAFVQRMAQGPMDDQIAEARRLLNGY